MNKITADDIRRLANVIRLNVSEAEVTEFTEQLNEAITYANNLNELSVAEIQPTTHVIRANNVFREDKVIAKISNEEALQNVPEHEDGLVKVPAILE